MKNKSSSAFEYLGHVVKLVLSSRRNTKGQVEFDGDSLNLKVNDVNVVQVLAAGPTVTGTLTADTVDVTTLSTGTGGVSPTSGVVEKTVTTTLTAAQIVGTAAGDIGHASGAILVASPGSDYVLELVSAVLIYDYLTGAYTGGGDDTTIQLGTVDQTAAIAGADLLEASGDKIVMLTPIAATDLPMTVGTSLNLQGTALTAGTGAGVLRCNVTYRIHTTGL